MCKEIFRSDTNRLGLINTVYLLINEPHKYLQINKKTVVCSKHFKPDDYRPLHFARKCLKPTAVPSLFDWSNVKPPRRALKRKLLADERYKK